MKSDGASLVDLSYLSNIQSFSKQGCFLAAILFSIPFMMMMNNALSELDEDTIYIRYWVLRNSLNQVTTSDCS